MYPRANRHLALSSPILWAHVAGPPGDRTPVAHPRPKQVADRDVFVFRHGIEQGDLHAGTELVAP